LNWEAVGALAELLGAAGVIGSLAYLAVQIRINTKSVQAASYQSLSQGVQEMNREVYGDPGTAEFLERAFTTEDEFEPVEQRRWVAFASTMFRHYDNIFHQHQMGALQDSQFESAIAVAHFNMRSARLRSTWKEMRTLYRDPFRSYLDSISERAASGDPTRAA